MDEQTIAPPQLEIDPDQSGVEPCKTRLIPKTDPPPPPDYVKMHEDRVVGILQQIEGAQTRIISITHQLARRNPNVTQSIIRDALDMLSEAVFQAGWLVEIMAKIPVIPRTPPEILEQRKNPNVSIMSVRDFAQYAHERFGVDLKEMVAELERQKPAEMPPVTTRTTFERTKKPEIHHLYHGRSACGMSARFGVPQVWPEGHKWSADWKDVTCAFCLEYKAIKDGPGKPPSIQETVKRLRAANVKPGADGSYRVFSQKGSALDKLVGKARVHLRPKKSDDTTACGKKLAKFRRPGNGTFWTLAADLVTCKNCKRAAR